MSFEKLLRAAALLSGFVLVTPGCGDDAGDSSASVQKLCNEVADSTCEKLYECFSASLLAENDFPSTLAGCKAMLREERGCEAADANDMCSGSEVFDETNARKCANQLQASSCNQVLSARVLADYAPACDRVCLVE